MKALDLHSSHEFAVGVEEWSVVAMWLRQINHRVTDYGAEWDCEGERREAKRKRRNKKEQPRAHGIDPALRGSFRLVALVDKRTKKKRGGSNKKPLRSILHSIELVQHH